MSASWNDISIPKYLTSALRTCANILFQAAGNLLDIEIHTKEGLASAGHKGSHPVRKVQFFLTLFKTPVATIINKITRKSMVEILNLDNLTLYLGHF